jgi:acylglycerol lipase
MMNNDSFTARDGLKIFTANMLPIGTPKAVVLVIHGYGEHCGRYAHVLSALCKAGYAAYALDHCGHGHSEGTRAYFDSFDQPITHLKEYMDRVKAAQPGKPVFLLGHSMGALISLAFALRYQAEIAGLLVSGAPVNADANVSPLVVQVGYVLNRIAPRLPLMKMVGLDTLSSDPQVAQKFAADPLTYKDNMRVGMGVQINETAKAVRADLPKLTLPMLIMHGEQDRLVNPSGSHTTYERVSSADKTLKIYPGMYHEIMNERDKAVVLADILMWLDKHANN